MSRRYLKPGVVPTSIDFSRSSGGRQNLKPGDPVLVTEPFDKGWTSFDVSGDSRVVYVSSSEGNDGNDGLSPDNAKLTVAAGVGLLRDGFPDHLRLKRGDVWTDENLMLPLAGLSGRSVSERMVFEAYGPETEERPLLKTGVDSGISAFPIGGGDVFDFLAFLDLDFIGHIRDPDDPAYNTGEAFFDDGAGLAGTSRGSYWHLEGCRWQHYGAGMTIQNIDDPVAPIDTVVIRRCVIADCYTEGAGFSQGLYFYEVDNVILEQCLVDSHSYNGQVIFNHNVYFQNGTVGTNTIFRENLFTRGPDVQMREGGICHDNHFSRTWISLVLGGGDDPNPAGVVVNVTDNVITEGVDLDESNARAWGINIANFDGAGGSLIQDNIIAHVQGGPEFPIAYRLDSLTGGANLINDLTFRNNKVYNWNGAMELIGTNFTNITLDNNVHLRTDSGPGLIIFESSEQAEVTASVNRFYSPGGDGVDFSIGGGNQNYSTFEAGIAGGTGNSHENVTFLDPNRTIARYNNEVLGGSISFEEFITVARNNRKGNWDERYTAPALNEWIREGFVEI